MKYIIGIIVILLVLFSIRSFLLATAAKTDGGQVTIADIPRIIQALSSSGKDGSFAVLLVPNYAGSDDYNANLQFSISNSQLGFDWVLLAEQNIADRGKVETLAKSLNYDCQEESVNGVSFIRCEGAKEYFTLASSILTEIYGIRDDQEIRLIIESFDWANET